jgi:hypothetical protein
MQSIIRTLLIISLALIVFTQVQPGRASQTAAACNVFGLISQNTTWSPQGCDPYIVTGNVTVAENVTLTIAPGTTVRLNKERSLTIKGTLLARGSADARITFTSNQASPAKGDWAQIVFEDSSSDATFGGDGSYASGSVLQYTTVEYGGLLNDGLVAAIEARSSAPFFDQNIIRQNRANGLVVNGEAVRVTNNLIDNNGGPGSTFFGVYGGGLKINGDRALIAGNTITNNFANDGAGGMYQDSGLFVEGSWIMNNLIKGNSTNGAAGGLWAEEAFIIGNIIEANEAGGDGGGIRFDDTMTVVSGNTIVNNRAGAQGGGIFYRSNAVSSSQGRISGNLIANNSATANGGGIFAAFSFITVTDNDIYSNTANSQPNDLYVYSTFNEPMPAENNWWGTTDSSAIEDRIFHNTDESDLTLVDFEPSRSSSARQETSIDPTGSTFQSSDGRVNVTLPAAALASAASLSYTALTTPTIALPTFRRPLFGFQLQARSTTGAPQNSLAQPAIISVSYTEAELQALGVSEASLQLVGLNGTTWQALLPCDTCGIDYVNNRITGASYQLREVALTGGQLRLYMPLVRGNR